MSIIIKWSSFTLSMIAVNFALQTQYAKADANDDFYTQTRDLMKKGKYNKEAGNKIYQNTLIKARTQQVNAISANNTAHNESLKNYVEKPDINVKGENAPGSKENPIDKKTGLSKIDKKPANPVEVKNTGAEKTAKKTPPIKEIPKTSESSSTTTIKVDDSNLPPEMTFPGTGEEK